MYKMDVKVSLKFGYFGIFIFVDAVIDMVK